MQGHLACSPTQGQAFDASHGTRDPEARMLELEGQALTRRAQGQRWSSQVLLRPQPRHHAVLQSPKSRKSHNVGRTPRRESINVGQGEAIIVSLALTTAGLEVARSCH